jgi:hypothetical protein
MNQEQEDREAAIVVAERLQAALIGRPVLTQKQAVRIILQDFDGVFLYKNKRHHWAIDRLVLSAFLKLTGDDVVWERGKQRWRRRRDSDKPGRQQR